MAEDSAGQTASATITVGIAAEDCAVDPGPTPTPVPTVAPPTTPSVAFVNAPLTLGAGGADLAVAPSAPLGFKQVDVFLGTTRVCTITTAPYSCRVRPTGGDVGIQEVRAVLTDVAGNTALAAIRVEVPRFEARLARASPARPRTCRATARASRSRPRSSCPSASAAPRAAPTAR